MICSRLRIGLSMVIAIVFAATLPAADPVKTYTIGMIGKSQGNPFFEAAHAGANAAAAELGTKYGITIKIDWRTPNEEDAQKQAELMEQLLLAGANGIIVSCSDANKLNDVINKAAKQEVPVATFSGDAPASQRFVALGIDDFECGLRTAEELSKLMDGKGVVAAIDGNPNAANLQQRAAGFRAGIKKHPGLKIVAVFFHKETPQDAVARIEQAMQASPDITGWGLLGGWPLFTENALKWQPGTVKCVCVDALPKQLGYVRSGHVPLLLAQDVYGYGYRSVEHVINKIHLKKDPPKAIDNSPLTTVTKDNVDEFAKNWEKWMPAK